MAIIFKRSAFAFHLVLAMSVVLASIAFTGDEFQDPPERPVTFTSAEELKKYVEALNKYYNYKGRIRLEHI